MSAILVLLLLLAAVTGTAVVLTRDPRRQIVPLALNGLALTLLFTALQAPDVALSELAVGTAAVPLLFFIALSVVRVPKQAEPEEEP
ncbi:hydrogenase subunit MbhD domain-containing protein [Methylobacterium sp. JK268]